MPNNTRKGNNGTHIGSTHPRVNGLGSTINGSLGKNGTTAGNTRDHRTKGDVTGESAQRA